MMKKSFLLGLTLLIFLTGTVLAGFFFRTEADGGTINNLNDIDLEKYTPKYNHFYVYGWYDDKRGDIRGRVTLYSKGYLTETIHRYEREITRKTPVLITAFAKDINDCWDLNSDAGCCDASGKFLVNVGTKKSREYMDTFKFCINTTTNKVDVMGGTGLDSYVLFNITGMDVTRFKFRD